MKLELDRIDLEPKHEGRNCSTIHFEHFKPEIQSAITVVGRATFYEFDQREAPSIRNDPCVDSE